MDVYGKASGRILGTEVFLSRIVRLDKTRVRLGCKVDRLELHSDGILEVLDYKTSLLGRVPTEESLSVDLPTFVYYVLARVVYPEHRRVIVSQLNVLTLAKVEVEYNPLLLTLNKRALIDLVHEIENGNFEPRPTIVCAWYLVKEFCPIFGGETDLGELI